MFAEYVIMTECKYKSQKQLTCCFYCSCVPGTSTLLSMPWELIQCWGMGLRSKESRNCSYSSVTNNNMGKRKIGPFW